MKLIPNTKSLEAWNARRSKSATGLVCHAPFKSMYIGLRGIVYTCCFNKSHVLGRYPEQSLYEIWNGPQAREIRQSIGKNDLSNGCHECYNLIEAGNYAALPVANFDKLGRSPKNYPTKIDFELSNTCNLECVMCRGEFSSSIRKNRENLPPIPMPYDAAFVEQLEEFIPHLEEARFLGGEPFMIPVYLEIWEKMTQLNPNARIYLTTNGTILSDRIKKIMEGMRFNLNISLDSINKENFERIRKNGNFDKVKANLAYFREYCDRKETALNISFCPMVDNWQELPDLIRFCNELRVQVFFNTVLFPFEHSLQSLDTKELTKVETSLKGFEPPAADTLSQLNRQAYLDVLRQVQKLLAESKEKEARGEGVYNTYDSWLIGLQKYIRSDITESDGQAEDLFTEIRIKLDYILSEAHKNGQATQAQQKLIQVNFQKVCQAVPQTDHQRLYELFQVFILPSA